MRHKKLELESLLRNQEFIDIREHSFLVLFIIDVLIKRNFYKFYYRVKNYKLLYLISILLFDCFVYAYNLKN